MASKVDLENFGKGFLVGSVVGGPVLGTVEGIIGGTAALKGQKITAEVQAAAKEMEQALGRAEAALRKAESNPVKRAALWEAVGVVTAAHWVTEEQAKMLGVPKKAQLTR